MSIAELSRMMYDTDLQLSRLRHEQWVEGRLKELEGKIDAVAEAILKLAAVVDGLAKEAK